MLTRSGYVIDKKEVDPRLLDKMRKDLTVAPVIENPPAFCPFPKKFKVYLESSSKICIPRQYAREQEGLPAAKTSWKKVEERPALRFTGTLKTQTMQPQAVEACMKCFQEYGGGILSLPTGYGKTTVALHIACKVGLKTLVVTHKEFLADQWIERIHQFVPGTKVGRIQGDISDVESCDIVVGMLQSLSMKDYDPSIFEGFGLLIIDEVHHVSAPVFSKCLLKTCCPYILGLSATPHRKDGLTKVIEWFLGPIFFKIERENQTGVRVECVTYKCERYYLPPPLIRGKSINLAKLVNDLADDVERNCLIAATATALMKKGRKIIILSDRRGHCEKLVQMIGEDRSGLYIGGMSQDELKEAERKDVIIATYGLANEGLDIPKLDTLILSTPKSDVVQSVGRILRENHSVAKMSPLIIDVIDAYSVFYAQFNKRKRYYDQVGFEVVKEEAECFSEEEEETFAFVVDD